MVNLIKIKCQHEKTLYYNEQNGYTVASYKTDDKDSVPAKAISKYQPKFGKAKTAFTATGNRLPTAEGVEIELLGSWIDGDKYGMQLSVESCSIIRPQTAEGIIAYLSSDLIKGIGDKTAKAIVDRFGVHALNIIDNSPNRLLEVPGITEKKLATIMQGYRQSVGLRDIMTELAQYGVTPKKAEKIPEAYGSQAVDIVKANPYILCNIAGLGFKTVDEIAQKSGIAYNDPNRIAQGIIYTLKQSQQWGHLFMQSRELCVNAVKLLCLGTADSVVFKKTLLDLVLKEHLREENGRIYLPKNYIAERETAELAKAMIKPLRVRHNIDDIILQAEKSCGIILTNMQRNAVKMAVTNNISIITGGPGTGKTTVVQVIYAVYKKIFAGIEVAFAAPTGRAARRLSESVHAPASTLHSLLRIKGDSVEDGDNPENEDNEGSIRVGLLVVDEVSMMDMSLTHQLFKRLDPSTKLILTGDYNQLPSVGAGNVLKELLQSEAIPVTKLDIVHRQAQTSRINLNAHAILQNKVAGLMYGSDFDFIATQDPGEAAEYVKSIYYNLVRGADKSGKAFDMNDINDMNDVQILSPMRVKGKCATDVLNREIQDVLNPALEQRSEITVGFKRFRIHDKVMQTKNNNTDDVSNGEIGYIRSIEKNRAGLGLGSNSYEVQIDFYGGRRVIYSPEQMLDVDLAYATTIHKSQGSEYRIVIIPILKEATIMLQRNLIYTAITRARDKVILVGQKEAFFAAIHRTDAVKRNTVLSELIAG